MKSINFLLFIWMIFTISFGYAQCLEGDCENGFGKSDLFYAIYEGTFLNGIPHGAGKLFYEEYTYVGEISEGLENGHGTLYYKDGSFEELIYEKGNKVENRYEKVSAKNWKSYKAKRDKQCISGDCANGKGVYLFVSGNRYEGNFKNFQPDGFGTWIFANGDKYKGNLKKGVKNGKGTYYYSNGWTFSGTYNKDSEFNGTYTTNKGKKVKIVNGKVQFPKPKITYTVATGVAKSNQRKCPICFGKGEQSVPGGTALISGSSSNFKSVADFNTTSYTYNVRLPDKKKTCDYCKGKGVLKN